MREIVFRGKAVIDFEIEQVCEFWERKVLENGNWIQGDLIWNNGIPFIVHGVIEANDEYISLEWWMPVDPETVGQFTGLLDKSGDKIFEGDIVKYAEGFHHWSGAYETPTLVEYECGGFYPFAGEGEYAMSSEYAIIIGNIHDNPELLGGK